MRRTILRSTARNLSRTPYGSKNADLASVPRVGPDKLHFKQRNIDKGVFYHGELMFLIYIDDGIIAHPPGNR